MLNDLWEDFEIGNVGIKGEDNLRVSGTFDTTMNCLLPSVLPKCIIDPVLLA